MASRRSIRTTSSAQTTWTPNYVPLAYGCHLDPGAPIELDGQHSEATRWNVNELLECEAVHEKTKAYFAEDRSICRGAATVKTLTIIAAAVWLLSGCALEKKGQWVRPGVTEAQWKQDKYECTRDATYYEAWAPFYPYHWRDYSWGPRVRFVSTSPRLDSYLYEMCLEAKGYAWKPEE